MINSLEEEEEEKITTWPIKYCIFANNHLIKAIAAAAFASQPTVPVPSLSPRSHTVSLRLCH